jgi:glycosyltransferase involved in cell wall biosynthesis
LLTQSLFPLKILVISNYNDFHTVRPEAEIFLHLAQKGFDITVMTFGGSDYARCFAEAGIRVIDFHPRHKFSRKEALIIRQELIRGDYDVLHLFNSQATVTGLRATRGLPVKVILYRGYTGNIQWWNPAAYLKYLHPRVDKVVCNSSGVEALLQRQWTFRNDKAVTILKGHRPEWYADIDPASLERFGVEEGDLVLVCVANNRRMKGVPFLLKAFRHLPPGLPVQLILAGRDMDSPSNLRIVRKTAYAGRIHFPGFIPEVLRTVAAADVFVLPSLFGESITKSAIEAMSLGLCPLITDIPGNVELVEDGKNGRVVPAGDARALAGAIMDMVKDRETCRRFGEAARRHIAENLHHDATVEGYLRMYPSLDL